MITLRDCYGLSDAVPDEVTVIACHEKLPPILAASKAYALLLEPWGPPAMRQMILDEYCHAGIHKDSKRCEELAGLYEQAKTLHSGGRERRKLRR